MGRVKTEPDTSGHPDSWRHFGSLRRHREGSGDENSPGIALMGLRGLIERVHDAPALGAAVMLLWDPELGTGQGKGIGQRSGCSIAVVPRKGAKGAGEEEEGDKDAQGGNCQPEENKDAERGMDPALIWRHRTGITEQSWGWTGLDWASTALRRSGWHRAATRDQKEQH